MSDPARAGGHSYPAAITKKSGGGIVTVDADYSALPSDFRINAIPQAAGITVTMPPPSQWPGKIIAVHSEGDAAGTITVTDGVQSDPAFADVVLTADGDYVLLASDGAAIYSVKEVST